MHSFDGDAAELDALLGLGLHIGVNGCSLRTADNLAVAAAVPAERLHLETDAPWCGIKRTHAGRRAVCRRRREGGAGAGAGARPGGGRGPVVPRGGGGARAPLLCFGQRRHSHVRPDPSLPAEVKKEKWVDGATVKDRCEPCYIAHVLQVLCGARLAARAGGGKGGGGKGGGGGAPSDEQLAEEARVAAAAYSNSMRVFWPGERA